MYVEALVRGGTNAGFHISLLKSVCFDEIGNS